MRLLFDALELTPDSKKSRGIYNYAVALCLAMSDRLKDGDTMVVACNGENIRDLRALNMPARVELIQIKPAIPGHLFRQWWMRLGVYLFARRQAIDVYLSPKGFVPAPPVPWLRRRLPAVCILHDLIPFWYFKHLPAYFGFLETMLVGSALRNSMAHASRIVAISHATKRALLSEGVPEQRISVVHNGLPMSEAHVGGAIDSPETDYVFGMASALPHKNLDGLLKAYRAYRTLAGPAALPLRLCGISDTSEEGVQALGTVSNEALLRLFRQASAFLFLPFIEGFGFPPLEALRHGTPVLCAKIEALEETCGPLATYVDPTQAGQAGKALHAMLSGRAEHDRASLARAAVQRTEALFGWQACADGVIGATRMACAVEGESWA